MMREIRAMGWDVRLTRGNHLVCTHPDTTQQVFCAATPSDRKWKKNTMKNMRKALRKK
jgi:predicted RNA binding protein YcfA (HicA-like mRNA interferase family)